MTSHTPAGSPLNILVVDDHLLLKIQSCLTPGEVFSAVQDWEAQQSIRGVGATP